MGIYFVIIKFTILFFFLANERFWFGFLVTERKLKQANIRGANGLPMAVCEWVEEINEEQSLGLPKVCVSRKWGED